MGPQGLPEDAILVAKAGRTHGVHGEIRLIPESGDPSRLLGLSRVWLLVAGEPARELRVEGARPHQGVALMLFEGIDTPEDASRLTNGEAWASFAELPPRDGDEFAVDEVVGAQLFDGERLVGEIAGVSSGAGRDFFEVEIAGQRELIPAVKDWLVEFDRPGRRIVMRLPIGLTGLIDT